MQVLAPPELSSHHPVHVKRVLGARSLGKNLVGPSDNLQLGLAVVEDLAGDWD